MYIFSLVKYSLIMFILRANVFYKSVNDNFPEMKFGQSGEESNGHSMSENYIEI